eukprot:TRINITY_DN791_c0_g1_i2.p1 TRINITY_DN791_c0_g1~~TRINITY_DN791_c0_g1_i2.p1  ORF type:complete len:421 (+),score=151.61 TRINITY_DN791_c0_g1_i2:384-1646(+)
MSERSAIIKAQDEKTLPGFVKSIHEHTSADVELVCDWDSIPTDHGHRPVTHMISQMALVNSWVSSMADQHKDKYVSIFKDHVKKITVRNAKSENQNDKDIDIDEAGHVVITAPLQRESHQYVGIFDLYMIIHHYLLHELDEKDHHAKLGMLKDTMHMAMINKDGLDTPILNLINHKHFYHAHDPFKHAIHTCQEHLMEGKLAIKPEEGEKFVKGYPVVKINQYDMDQERILLLTTHAFYTVMYNYATGEPDCNAHIHRNPLHIIEHVSFGEFVGGAGLAGAAAAAMGKAKFGMTVKFHREHADKTQQKGLHYTSPPELEDPHENEALFAELGYALVALRNRLGSGHHGHHAYNHTLAHQTKQHRPKFPVPIGAIYNALKMGLCKKDAAGGEAAPAPAAAPEGGEAAPAPAPAAEGDAPAS